MGLQGEGKVCCSTEIVDEYGVIYRAHPFYRGSGYWHDWAWVSYEDEDSEDGYSDVPAKILCFLPEGFGEGDEEEREPLLVCHPCRWEQTNLSPLVRKWQLMTVPQRLNEGIPYDIVPVSALCGDCLIVPDLVQEGVVYEVADTNKWANLF
jgi:hypothetical protein